jgi:hypothetical protein
MPPAMKSKITESAVLGILLSQEESNPASGLPIPKVANVAALVFLRKSLRVLDVFMA